MKKITHKPMISDSEIIDTETNEKIEVFRNATYQINDNSSIDRSKRKNLSRSYLNFLR